MSRFELGKGSCGTSDLTVDEDDASIDASNASLLPQLFQKGQPIGLILRQNRVLCSY